jgi:hypothetical protein
MKRAQIAVALTRASQILTCALCVVGGAALASYIMVFIGVICFMKPGEFPQEDPFHFFEIAHVPFALGGALLGVVIYVRGIRLKRRSTREEFVDFDAHAS